MDMRRLITLVEAQTPFSTEPSAYAKLVEAHAQEAVSQLWATAGAFVDEARLRGLKPSEIDTGNAIKMADESDVITRVLEILSEQGFDL